jgi:hypothetical protein
MGHSKVQKRELISAGCHCLKEILQRRRPMLVLNRRTGAGSGSARQEKRFRTGSFAKSFIRQSFLRHKTHFFRHKRLQVRGVNIYLDKKNPYVRIIISSAVCPHTGSQTCDGGAFYDS